MACSHGGLTGLPQSVERMVFSKPSARIASRFRAALLTQRLTVAALQNCAVAANQLFLLLKSKVNDPVFRMSNDDLFHAGVSGLTYYMHPLSRSAGCIVPCIIVHQISHSD